MIEGLIAAIIGILAGVGGTVVYDKQKKIGGKHKADQTIVEAKTKASGIILKAQEESLRLAEETKREENNRRKGWEKTETRLAEREVNLDNKLDELDRRAGRRGRRGRVSSCPTSRDTAPDCGTCG